LNNKEQQQHEGYIVTRLIERFDISHKYKKRMYRENKNRFGESFLSLNMFFEFFPTFPARLVLAYPVNTPKVLSVDGLFRNFGGSWLMEDYVYRFRNYVEPGRHGLFDQGSAARFGGSCRKRPTTFGVIYHRTFERGGGYVLHNHPINVDLDGFRMYWVSEAGQQVVMETLDVLLDSIDAAALGGEGWVAEPSSAFALCA
jgi:hypothetical protein